jgi:hypothetical protein
MLCSITMSELDYRRLLSAYMAHVLDCEGVTFIEDTSNPPRTPYDALSAAEQAELRLIKAEVLEDQPAAPTHGIMRLTRCGPAP